MEESIHAGRKSKILIIDDDKNINHALKKFVELLGYDGINAYTGEEGLKLIIREKPDLVLLDIVMPAMSGFEVCRQIRERDDTRHILVIMLTSLGDRNDRIMGIEAGCDEFAHKPVSFEELKVRIKSLLKINYYRSKVDEKEKFERTVQAVNDGIFVLDKNFRIVEANPCGLRLMNISDSEARGLDIFKYMKKDFVLNLSGDITNPPKKNDITFEIRRPETEEVKDFFLLVRVQYLYDPSGTLASSIMTIHDITELKKEEHIKRNFISLISHKLLTPMTIVLGSQYVLKRQGFDNYTPEQRKLINQIFTHTNHLNELIEKLILFMEIFSGTFTEQKEYINITDFLQKIVTRYFSSIKKEGIHYQLDMPDREIRVLMVPRHLELIVLNLINNAIQHNTKKNKEVEIKLVPPSAQNGSEAVMVVKDNGAGIPPEEYQNIFGAFYQVEKYFTGQKEGIGVGLALVKQLVEQIGGSVQVESHLKKGSEFYIHLPTQK